MSLAPVRRPRGVLDDSEVKPPFFPPSDPKSRAPLSPQGGGCRHFVFHGTPSLHEAALTLLGAFRLPPPPPPPPPYPPPPYPPPPTPPCQPPLLLLLLLARLLLLRLFNRIVLASDSCGVGNKTQNAKKQTRRAASRQSQTLRAVQ